MNRRPALPQPKASPPLTSASFPSPSPSSSPAPVPASSPAPAAVPESSIDPLGPLCSLSEEVHERLKLLHYETWIASKSHLAFKPLHKLYFALHLKPSEQFPYYSHLTSWLLGLCGREQLDVNEFDDPNTISASIVENLNVLGANCEYQPTRLRHGSGDAVMHSLSFLTALALKKSSFIIQQPDYSLVTGTEDSDSALLPQDEGEEEILDTVDEDATLLEAEENIVHDAFAQVTQHIEPVKQVTSAEAAAWLLEVERVGAQLKGAPINTTTKEWRAHSEMLEKHEKLLTEATPELTKNLERVSTLLTKTLEQISQREKAVNRDYESLSSEMCELQAQQEKQQETYNTLSAGLLSLTERYRERVSELESAKERLDKRNDSMMDATPVRIMQKTVSRMKSEINEMGLKIGIVSQCLQAARQRQWLDKSRQAHRDEKERTHRGNRSQNKTPASRAVYR